MTSTPVADLRAILGAVGDLVAAVREDQWAGPTPCPEWNVRELVSHLVIGNRLFAGILRGEVAVSPGALDPKSSDVPGSDPVTVYRDAAQELIAAFARTGVLEDVFQVPVGRVPGIAALHLRATEALVHGWDLAQATGQQPPQVDDAIAERELEFTRAKLPGVPAGRTPFAPPQPAAADAPPITRLAALLGRHPGNPPPGADSHP